MKLLSIDVGIKNLAYCLFDFNIVTNMHDILLWDVINLCGQVPMCNAVVPVCNKKAKFSISVNDLKYFCPTHAKKSGFIIPSTTNISLKKIKKMKLIDLQQVIKDYNIPLSSTTIKKDDVLKTVTSFMSDKMLESVTATSAGDLDLVKLGIAMQKAFDKELVNHLETITHIVIENQISPIANRMKTLQGMIAQYFIMHDIHNIRFVSAANKLKGASPLTPGGVACVAGGENPPGGVGAGPQGYAARKKEGIKITQGLLNEKYIQWVPHFNQHKKKDDLADAFLQGIYVLNN
jgi:hypothetical protein